MFKLYDSPFIIPEDGGSSKGPLCLSFYSDYEKLANFPGFEIGFPLKTSTWLNIFYATLLIEFVTTGFKPCDVPSLCTVPLETLIVVPPKALFSLLQKPVLGKLCRCVCFKSS